MGVKKRDIFGAFCCSDCHDVLDGRVSANHPFFTRTEIKLMHYEGMERTQNKLIEMGVLIL